MASYQYIYVKKGTAGVRGRDSLMLDTRRRLQIFDHAGAMVAIAPNYHGFD